MAKLSSTELESFLSHHVGWQYDASGEIVKEFKFPAYADGCAFVAALARLADQRDHHPDLLLTYPGVRVSLSTHSEGGITQKDLGLAKVADQLALVLAKAP